MGVIHTGPIEAGDIGADVITATQIAADAVTKTEFAGGVFKSTIIDGGTAGDHAVSGIAVGDILVKVYHISTKAAIATMAALDTSDFTVGAGKITDTLTDSSNDQLLVLWEDLT